MRIVTVKMKNNNDGIPRHKFNERCVRHAYLRSVKIGIMVAFATNLNSEQKSRFETHLPVTFCIQQTGQLNAFELHTDRKCCV